MGPIQLSIATALTFSAIHFLNNHFSRTLPKELTETTGLIKPSKILSVFCVIVTEAMFTGGLWLLFSDDEIFVGLACGGMGLFGFIVMLTTLHNVKWDDTGVYGPAGGSFPSFPTQQIKIAQYC